MAARIKRLWSTNPARGIPTREQDDFCVGERSRSDSIVQCLTEIKCGGHAAIGSGQVPWSGANGIDGLGEGGECPVVKVKDGPQEMSMPPVSSRIVSRSLSLTASPSLTQMAWWADAPNTTLAAG